MSEALEKQTLSSDTVTLSSDDQLYQPCYWSQRTSHTSPATGLRGPAIPALLLVSEDQPYQPCYWSQRTSYTSPATGLRGPAIPALLLVSEDQLFQPCY